MSKKKIILVINCPDKAGIIAAVSTFLFKRKFNILESSQYKDSKNNQFFICDFLFFLNQVFEF